jgi:hypothetical protein
MTEKKIQKPSFRTLRLKAIAEAKKRGDRNYNIWAVYSTKIKKDLVLIGDVEYLNFHWMEGDPDVASFTVDSDLYLADGDESNGATYPDAVATLRDGTIQWREAKSVEAGESTERDVRQQSIQRRITDDLGYAYLRVTPALLKKNWQFICNWRRATAFCAATRHLSIHRFEDEVSTLVHTRRSIRLEDVLNKYHVDDHPLVMAALMTCAQTGMISTNLDKFPLGPRTIFEAP